MFVCTSSLDWATTPFVIGTGVVDPFVCVSGFPSLGVAAVEGSVVSGAVVLVIAEASASRKVLGRVNLLIRRAYERSSE